MTCRKLFGGQNRPLSYLPL